jgi:hypothetical protein
MDMGTGGIVDAIQVEGTDEAHKKLQEWLSKQLKSSEIEGEAEITLFQVSSSDKEPVTSLNWETGDKIAPLVDEIIEAADEDAREIVSGRIKYSVEIDGVRGRCTFALKVIGREDDDIDDIDEVPNERGVTHQLMRHQEKFVKLSYGMVEKTQKMLFGQMKEKDDRIQALEQQQVENMKIYEDLLQQRHVRELEIRKVTKEEERKEQLLGIVATGAPAVLNLLSAKKGDSSAKGPSQTEMLLMHLVSSFDQEQLQKLMGSGLLNQAQLLTFIELMKQTQQRREELEGQAKQAGEEAANQ